MSRYSLILFPDGIMSRYEILTYYKDTVSEIDGNKRIAQTCVRQEAIRRGEILTSILRVKDEKDFKEFLELLEMPEIRGLNGEKLNSDFFVFQFEQRKLRYFIAKFKWINRPARAYNENQEKDFLILFQRLKRYAHDRTRNACHEPEVYDISHVKLTKKAKALYAPYNSAIIGDRYATDDIFAFAWIELLDCLKKHIEVLKCPRCGSYFFTAKYKNCKVCFMCKAPSRVSRMEMSKTKADAERLRANLSKKIERGTITLQAANAILKKNKLKPISQHKK